MSIQTWESTLDGEDIFVLCFDIVDNVWPDWVNSTMFGFLWTDGEEWLDDGNDVTDGVFVKGLYDDEADLWEWFVHDSEDDTSDGADALSAVWAEYTEEDTLTDWTSVIVGDHVRGTFCVYRSLLATEEGDLDLPFKEGTDFISYYEFVSEFWEVVYGGSMSLGLALASAAGAALALM